MGLWYLSLEALTKGDAEKVKSYAKELNNGEYNFHPFDESTLTGLEDIDMGIMYSHVTPDCLDNFFKFSEEIAAHFSEVKLIYEEFDIDTQQLFTYWSNNGILRLIKKCKIELYAADNFEVVRDFAVSAAVEAGLELNDCTEANAISFTYDALQKQEKVDLILDSLSIQFPNTEIVCLKETDDDPQMPYESCCVISNGACKWHQLDYDTNFFLMGIMGMCNSFFNRFEFAKNPVETDNSFYIIRMDRLFDQEATDEERESIIAGRKNDLYDEIVDGYKASADWTIDEKVWEPVNFDTIYSKAKQEDTSGQTDTNATVEE